MTSNGALRESDLIFPTAHTSIHTTLGELRRDNLTIKHRLRSIIRDSEFVKRTKVLGLPLIANERCGSWYIDPEDKHGSAYFKSTDGHFGQWSFNVRRMNLQLLDIIGARGGCIIVDSTRRGKSMPDALSKTVPIWIAVLNRFLFPDYPDSHQLLTPPEVVSESEHAQIEVKLDHFVELVAGLRLDVAELRQRLARPMRPYWLAPESELDVTFDADFQSVVLCTASSKDSRSYYDDPEYVQGAADDQESWACGLTPEIFWLHRDVLLTVDEDNLPEQIRSLVDTTIAGPRLGRLLVKPTKQVLLSDLSSALDGAQAGDIIVYCSLGPALKAKSGADSCATSSSRSMTFSASSKLDVMSSVHVRQAKISPWASLWLWSASSSMRMGPAEPLHIHPAKMRSSVVLLGSHCLYHMLRRVERHCKA